jgi:hypothetical protein
MIIINNRDKIDWKEKLIVTDVFGIMGYYYALITLTVDVEFVPEEYDAFVIPDGANVLMIQLAPAMVSRYAAC